MKIMYELTGDRIFEEYYKKWKSYWEDPWNILTKRIATQKNLAIYALNVGVVFVLALCIAKWRKLL